MEKSIYINSTRMDGGQQNKIETETNLPNCISDA